MIQRNVPDTTRPQPTNVVSVDFRNRRVVDKNYPLDKAYTNTPFAVHPGACDVASRASERIRNLRISNSNARLSERVTTESPKGSVMENTLHLIFRTHGVVRRKTDQRLMQLLGITYSQAKVIDRIFIGREQLNVELAEWLNCDVGAMSRLISRLVTKELVERWIDEQDRRCVRVALTSKGRMVASRIRFILEEVETGLFDILTVEENEHLRAMLDRMNVLLNGVDRSGSAPRAAI